MRSDEMVGRLKATRAEYDAMCAASLEAYTDNEVVFSCHRFGDGHVSSESAGRGPRAIALDDLPVGDLVAVSSRYKRPQP